MRNIRDYLWARTPTQALKWMTTRPGRGAFLGGGTLLAARQDGDLDFVVDLSRAGLQEVEESPDSLQLGATLPLQQLIAEPRLQEIGAGLLIEAVRATRTDPWRRQATLAGRILEREAGDLVTLVLSCLGATLGVLRPGREQPEWLDLEAGVRACRTAGPSAGATATVTGAPSPALVTAVRVPRPQPGWSFALERVARSALDVSLAAVAVAVRGDSGRLCEASIAATAGSIPQRAPRAETAARDRTAEELGPATKALLSEIEPAGDWRASAAYRRQVLAVLLARALRRALAADAPGAR
jgi:carbon-monoxide dehydrogenase medium subunit